MLVDGIQHRALEGRALDDDHHIHPGLREALAEERHQRNIVGALQFFRQRQAGARLVQRRGRQPRGNQRHPGDSRVQQAAKRGQQIVFQKALALPVDVGQRVRAPVALHDQAEVKMVARGHRNGAHSRLDGAQFHIGVRRRVEFAHPHAAPRMMLDALNQVAGAGRVRANRGRHPGLLLAPEKVDANRLARPANFVDGDWAQGEFTLLGPVRLKRQFAEQGLQPGHARQHPRRRQQEWGSEPIQNPAMAAGGHRRTAQRQQHNDEAGKITDFGKPDQTRGDGLKVRLGAERVEHPRHNAGKRGFQQGIQFRFPEQHQHEQDHHADHKHQNRISD